MSLGDRGGFERVKEASEFGVVGEVTGGLGFSKLRLEVFDLGEGRVFGEWSQVIDEEFAVEVVGFMLDGAAEKLVGLKLDFLALKIVGPHPDFAGPTHFCVKTGKAEATFFVLGRGMAFNDLGIDENLFLIFLLGVGGGIQDEKSKGECDLVGGQADASGLVHQVEHNANGRSQVVIDACDGSRFVAKRGMGKWHDPRHKASP